MIKVITDQAAQRPYPGTYCVRSVFTPVGIGKSCTIVQDINSEPENVKRAILMGDTNIWNGSHGMMDEIRNGKKTE